MRVPRTFSSIVFYCMISVPTVQLSAVLSAERLVDGDPRSGSGLDGLTIDSIEIDNRNIYNTHDELYRAWYYRWANKLHIVSRKKVLGRELLFKVGDSFSVQLAEEVTRNLRTKYPLNDAWIETERLEGGGLLVRIVTVDRWSLIVETEITRDGNETNYTFGLEERNLLGTNRFLQFNYSVYETEKDFVSASFKDFRLFGNPYSLQWEFKGQVTDEINTVTLSRPYYNLDQRLAFSVGFGHSGGRQDVYDNADLIALSNLNNNSIAATVRYRWGAYRRKIGIEFKYDYRDLSSRDKLIFDSSRSGLVDFADDSLFHQIGAGVTAEFPTFTKEHRINGFSFTEDFVLGGEAALSISRAVDSRLNSHFYDLLEAKGGFGYKLGQSLILSRVSTRVWFRTGRRLRQRNVLSLRLYNNRLDFLTIAFRSLFVSDWRHSAVNPLILGGINGLRGYDRFFRTGDRVIVSNLEGRFFPGLELLSAQVGGAAFVDAGRSYYAREPFVLHNLNVSIGIGLRISLEKLDKSQLIRIDYARAQDNQWELSFSSGQYF